MHQTQQTAGPVRPLRTLELFAGVGGFRMGLAATENGQQAGFEVVWANQFEPSMQKQWAAEVYRARWGSQDLVNEDLFKVLEDDAALARIDALDPEVLVGGFPCQDYSVAQPLSRSQGLAGKKGVLWWGIHRLLELRIGAGRPVKYVMLENVDRLISSPASCKGRDFAIILASLQQLGYAVEWRVVNAADYGYPQKRRRIFIQAYHQSTPLHTRLAATVGTDAASWMTRHGPMAQALPAQLKAGERLRHFELPADTFAAQEEYATDKGRSRFASGGVCVGGQVWTAALEVPEISDYTPFVGQSAALTLGDIVRDTTDVPASFFLTDEALPRWEALKGAKSIERVSADGHAYTFSEGAMAFPDPLDRPSRTVITSEGGTSASRTTHVVQHGDGRLRRLTPEELEALNGFARGFTDIAGIKPARRAFLMGNALVTGIVTRLGQALVEAHAGTTDAAPTETATPARTNRTGEVRRALRPHVANATEDDSALSLALYVLILRGIAQKLDVVLPSTDEHETGRWAIDVFSDFAGVIECAYHRIDPDHGRIRTGSLIDDMGRINDRIPNHASKSATLLRELRGNGRERAPPLQSLHNKRVTEVEDKNPIGLAQPQVLVVKEVRSLHQRILDTEDPLSPVLDVGPLHQRLESLLGQMGMQHELCVGHRCVKGAVLGHIERARHDGPDHRVGDGFMQTRTDGRGVLYSVKHANLLKFRESALRHCNADHTPQARGPTARHASRDFLELGLIGGQPPAEAGFFGHRLHRRTFALTRQMRVTHRGAHLGVTECAHHVIELVGTVDEQARKRVPQVMHANLGQAGFLARCIPRIKDGNEGLAGLGAGEHPLRTCLGTRLTLVAPWHRAQQRHQRVGQLHRARLARLCMRHEPGPGLEVDVFPARVEHLALAQAGQQERGHNEAQEFVGARFHRLLQTGHLCRAQEALTGVLRVDQLDLACRVVRHPGRAPLDGEIEEITHQNDAAIGRPAGCSAREIRAVKALHVVQGDFGQSPRPQCWQQMIAQDALVGVPGALGGLDVRQVTLAHEFGQRRTGPALSPGIKHRRPVTAHRLQQGCGLLTGGLDRHRREIRHLLLPLPPKLVLGDDMKGLAPGGAHFAQETGELGIEQTHLALGRGETVQHALGEMDFHKSLLGLKGTIWARCA
ncbi:Cytosine-specific methyltransferase (modular protein) [Thauera humireducens]|nr:Cytosine-specific methyltransferase (modular protein) [Thauera humireducens]